MLGVVAQWAREAIAERTSTALAQKRGLRQAYGPTPFGFRRVGDALVADPAEQNALAEAVAMDRDPLQTRCLRSFSGGALDETTAFSYQSALAQDS